MTRRMIKNGIISILSLTAFLILVIPSAVPAQEHLTLTKTVSPQVLNLTVGESQTVTYTITVAGIIEEIVNVVDTNLTDPLTFTEDGSQTYEREFTCEMAGTTEHQNTATIVDTTISDDATVILNCAAIPVVPDEEPEVLGAITTELPVELPRSGPENYSPIYVSVALIFAYITSKSRLKKTMRSIK